MSGAGVIRNGRLAHAGGARRTLLIDRKNVRRAASTTWDTRRRGRKVPYDIVSHTALHTTLRTIKRR
jgi:hypothetical protein